MGLRDRFSDSMKLAMKAKETKRLGTVRLMMAEVQKQGIATRNENPTDEDWSSVAMALAAQHQNLLGVPIYSFRLKRAEEYSMNYYLRRELAPWRGERGSDVLVLTDVRNRNEARKLGLICPDLLFEHPIVEVCTTSVSVPSLDHIGGSNNNRNPADRQAR